MKKLVIEASDNNLDKVLAFVDEQLDALNCPAKAKIQINIALEELFVNIAHYAYDSAVGTAEVQVLAKNEPPAVEITFIDEGKPYDPLAKSDPDVTLSVEERQIGGLGIYMVKKSMDDVLYRYERGRNILTIQKKL